MSFHYWRNSGRPEKTQFVSLAGSYHGETLGALSVTDVALFKDTYAPLLRASAQVPSPDWRLAEPGESRARLSRRAARTRSSAISQRITPTTAALIVEPLVQGASRHGDVRRRVSAARARDLRPLSTCTSSPTKS